MKAVIRRKYVPFNQLTIEEIEKPTPKDNEVLIRVYATTVNRTDCAIVSGKPFIMRFFTGLFTPNAPVPGTDFAGQVEAIGKAVTTFKVGDKVWGFHDEGLSSQAEYMTISTKEAISIIPDGITYEQAAASLEATHYAYNFMNKVNIKAGQKILVNGATGAIGSATLQFLKYRNCTVTAVCNTPNIAKIKALGADKIYDYLTEDFTKDTEKYDYVFDAVGKSTFGKCKHLLKPKGVYISSELGSYSQNPFLAIFTPWFGGRRVAFPLPQDIKRSIAYVEKLTKAGKFKPLMDRTYTLEQVAEAYQYVNSGQKTGNVILRIV